MPVPSQRQPHHPNLLSQFVGLRRFELASDKAFDLSGPELELVGQRFRGIVPPGKALLQVIRIGYQCGRHNLRNWLSSAFDTRA